MRPYAALATCCKVHVTRPQEAADSVCVPVVTVHEYTVYEFGVGANFGGWGEL